MDKLELQGLLEEKSVVSSTVVIETTNKLTEYFDAVMEPAKDGLKIGLNKRVDWSE